MQLRVMNTRGIDHSTMFSISVLVDDVAARHSLREPLDSFSSPQVRNAFSQRSGGFRLGVLNETKSHTENVSVSRATPLRKETKYTWLTDVMTG